MAKNMNFFYDQEGDILDISIGKPQEAVSHELRDDFFVRINNKKQVVGFMLFNFEKRFALEKKPVSIPVEATFNVPTGI